MTDRYRQRPPYTDEPPDSERYPAYAPGRGYTPPLGSPPPPKTFIARVTYSLRNYFGLQRRARINSMQWWLLKLVQGLLIATPLGVIGVGLVIGSSVVGNGQCLSGIGKAAVLASALAFLWYGLAPITQRWRVMIPEGEYWAVEDNNHYTLAFLRGGPQAVDWHWNVRLVKVIDFVRVAQRTRIDNVLVTNDQRVTLDIHTVMHVDPTRAPQQDLSELRKTTRPEQFQHQIDQHIRRVMLHALQRRSAADRAALLGDPSALEDMVLQSLGDLIEWGLLPVPGNPVSIQVISVPLPGATPATPAPSAQPVPPQPYRYDGPHSHGPHGHAQQDHRQRDIPTQPGTGPLPATPASASAPDAESPAHDTGSDRPASPAEPPTGSGEEWLDPLDRRRNEKKKRRGDH